MPPEGLKLCSEVSERNNLFDRHIGLKHVAIHNDRNVRMVVGGRLQRLPNLSFLKLSVTGHNNDPATELQLVFGPCHAPRLADTHPQRTRVGLATGIPHIGVAVKPTQAAELEQSIFRYQSKRVENRIKAGNIVAFRGKKDVPVRAIEPHLPNIQLFEVKPYVDVHGAEA